MPLSATSYYIMKSRAEHHIVFLLCVFCVPVCWAMVSIACITWLADARKLMLALCGTSLLASCMYVYVSICGVGCKYMLFPLDGDFIRLHALRGKENRGERGGHKGKEKKKAVAASAL